MDYIEMIDEYINGDILYIKECIYDNSIDTEDAAEDLHFLRKINKKDKQRIAEYLKSNLNEEYCDDEDAINDIIHYYLYDILYNEKRN